MTPAAPVRARYNERKLSTAGTEKYSKNLKKKKTSGIDLKLKWVEYTPAWPNFGGRPKT